MLNQRAHALFDHAWNNASAMRLVCHPVAGARLLDAGVGHPGSLAAGLFLARLCMSDLANISIVPRGLDPAAEPIGCDNEVYVQTDRPVLACLASQYAGWPVSAGDYFAMASGPMRMIRGRESMLLELGLLEDSDHAIGILESDVLPTVDALEHIASQCGVKMEQVSIAVAPSTSIAGSVQVVARSIETAMHKLHSCGFDVGQIVSATGVAPLPPPAKPGKSVIGIGRTNDAILYGGRVTFWVECEDEAIESVIDQIPSQSSFDYGRPFAVTFKDYGYDFYKVDPMLFSPAVVTCHNLSTGRTWQRGKIDLNVLRESFVS